MAAYRAKLGDKLTVTFDITSKSRREKEPGDYDGTYDALSKYGLSDGGKSQSTVAGVVGRELAGMTSDKIKETLTRAIEVHAKDTLVKKLDPSVEPQNDDAAMIRRIVAKGLRGMLDED